jgi:peptide/nickel transport system permease protein
MLNYGRIHLLDAPHLTIFPGLAIAVLVLGFNFLGDGLRDILDPKTGSART